MRFMVLVKSDADTEAGVLPSEELLTAMGRYNEELVAAGVLLAGEGLQASQNGARVQWNDGAAPTVVDGPFAEAKELVAGFWILQVKSKAEAIEWAKRCPAPEQGEQVLEVRQIFEMDDFGDAATPEVRESAEALRSKTEKK
ncbi:YciI family protein [Actinoalloteichus hymeniacidonis]|uniref:YCII-related domain-containing protein n=1 Tax=Actinoalloteichus hymeniacidonis TaxID=340345 RepID=A0AAC9HNZ9_9PSEU|nr:YciI family protein [Actinoalloteichus hymeniacidonis]AOS62800.1 hypothetical protein TL08_09925 [Actinoalloteichus hymeniacidonis]MBB5909169.1 hypothetical protein [Actinoalloteichus hymeniacidonis]